LAYNGLQVLPSGQDGYGSDVIVAHQQQNKADLVITLLDVWALNADLVKAAPMACWVPLDTAPLGDADKGFFDHTEARPIAMSRFGQRMLTDAGYDALYVPHGVDTSVFAPRADRDEIRERAGLDGKFVIGLLAANKDAIRKSFYPQMRAFQHFRKDHPDAHLLVHSMTTGAGALDLRRIAEFCEISDAVTFSDQYKLLMGLYAPSDIAAWLNCCDVLTNASMAEGFGLTPLEALACGVPAVVTDSSAMSELALSLDWCVSGEEFWNPTHSALWYYPYIREITDRYEMAYKLTHGDQASVTRAAAREKAMMYDVNSVLSLWQNALNELEPWLTARSRT
jgi:D-inositol-3-phosphate glycosyltransferase